MQPNWGKKVATLFSESREWAIEIIRQNEELLFKIREELSLEEISVENDIKLQSRILDLLREATDFKEYKSLCILYSACSTLRIVANLNPKEMLNSEAAATLYLLGCSHGCLEAVDENQMPTSLYEDFFHSVKSKKGIKKRWGQRDEKLREVERIAEEKYKNGCKDWHNDLACKISKKPQFKGVHIRQIRKVVGKVAEPYGLKRGVPKK